MSVTQCLAGFIAIPKDIYVTKHSLKQLHRIQSDVKETVVNKITTGVFEKKCPFCKESQRKVNKKEQPLISCTLESCEDFMKNIIINSDDQNLVYENRNIDFPVKEVCYHPKFSLQFAYQVSMS